MSLFEEESPKQSVDINKVANFVDEIETIIEEYSIENENLNFKLRDYENLCKEIKSLKEENTLLRISFDKDIQKLKEDTEIIMKRNLDILNTQGKEKEKLEFELNHFKKVNQEKTKIIEELELKLNHVKIENQGLVKELNGVKINNLNLKKEGKR